MRFSPMAVFTFLLLLPVAATAGFYGYSWGSSLGEEALTGITQLEGGLNRRPIRRAEQSGEDSTQSQKSEGFLSEAEILSTLKTKMEAGNATPFTASASPAPSNPQTPEEIVTEGFPIVARSQGVVMELRSVRVEGSSLILETRLRNDSTEAVRFLYSFLDVTDDQKQALSATVDGLPSELDPLSAVFEGTVRIPTTLLNQATHLSMTLTNYPDQDITLTFSEIPIPPGN